MLLISSKDKNKEVVDLNYHIKETFCLFYNRQNKM
nr:MAG TPA: hypothetical protein [Caudoviricetes sp.]